MDACMHRCMVGGWMMDELISEKQVMRVERREQPVSTGIVREGLWQWQSLN